MIFTQQAKIGNICVVKFTKERNWRVFFIIVLIKIKYNQGPLAYDFA